MATRSNAQDQEITVLLRAAILGDRDALGALCQALRPLVYSIAHDFLAGFHLENHTEDVMQDVFCDVCGSFATHDPARGTFKGWVATITRYNCYDFASRNRIAVGKVPLPDPEDDAGDAEYRLDPLDTLSRELWEQEKPVKPISQSNRYRVNYKARARMKAIAENAGKATTPLKRRRGGKKKTAWEMKRIKKNREAFVSGPHLNGGKFAADEGQEGI